MNYDMELLIRCSAEEEEAIATLNGLVNEVGSLKVYAAFAKFLTLLSEAQNDDDQPLN